MKKRTMVLAAMLLAVAVQGCVATSHQKLKQLSTTDGRPAKVVLMPVDVTLGHLTTGGAFEVQAEWTSAGEAHVKKALSDYLSTQNAQMVEYRRPEEADRQTLHLQLVKLHREVGTAIRLHQYQTPLQLPTKADSFEWSLGPDMKDIAETTGADYALFVHIKDSYSTAGRVVANVLVAVLFGTSLGGGQQIGYASLVDLDNGDVVWFNALARAEGDLRKPEPAAKSVALLMANFPK